jgi:ABC-2 type transport system permease protein
MDFIVTFIPTFILVYFLSGMSIPLGLNLIFFLVSVIMAVLINLSIDFFVGCIILYTMSTWGVNIMKEVIVLLLSGATIPLAFFPEPLKTIVMYLPFQAVYNAPLSQLIGEYSYAERFQMLGVQFFWVIAVFVISELFWRKSVKQITVNGG